MNLRHTLPAAMLSVLIAALCCPALCQEASTKTVITARPGIPGLFHKQIAALGRRMQPSSADRTIYLGQYFDGHGTARAAKVTQDPTGAILLEGFKADSTMLSFDGTKPIDMPASESDAALLEVFVMDSAEGMFESVRHNAAVRSLGYGIALDPENYPEYKGQKFDIYEVTGPVRSRQDRALRMRLYHFDSTTGLLVRTQYLDHSVNPPVKVETRYSVWGEIAGSKFPARIEHFREGKLQFTYISESIELNPIANTSEASR